MEKETKFGLGELCLWDGFKQTFPENEMDSMVMKDPILSYECGSEVFCTHSVCKIYVHTYICVHIHAHIYVYMYIYTFIDHFEASTFEVKIS